MEYFLGFDTMQNGRGCVKKTEEDAHGKQLLTHMSREPCSCKYQWFTPMKYQQQICVPGYFAMHQILKAMLEISDPFISVTTENNWPSNEIMNFHSVTLLLRGSFFLFP